MLHETRLFLERYRYTARLVSAIRKSKIWQRISAHRVNRSEYIRKYDNDRFSLMRAKKTRKEFAKCYNSHRSLFEAVALILEDEFSRKTLQTVIDYRLAPNKEKLQAIVVSPMYFQRELFSPLKDEVFVDGGAYTGDTIKGLEEFCGGGYWKKVYAWEPDAINRCRLIATCEAQKYQNIEIIPFGLWSKKTKVHFNQQGKDWSKVSEDGPYTVVADSIDNVCWGDKVTFIKLDIEGSELEALWGAVKIIRRDKPRLAISIYHKPQDYFEIPLYIKELVPEYKLYIRHHKLNKNDTGVYAML